MSKLSFKQVEWIHSQIKDRFMYKESVIEINISDVIADFPNAKCSSYFFNIILSLNDVEIKINNVGYYNGYSVSYPNPVFHNIKSSVKQVSKLNYICWDMVEFIDHLLE